MTSREAKRQADEAVVENLVDIVEAVFWVVLSTITYIVMTLFNITSILGDIVNTIYMITLLYELSSIVKNVYIIKLNQRIIKDTSLAGKLRSKELVVNLTFGLTTIGFIAIIVFTTINV